MDQNFVILGETMERQERRTAHVVLSSLGIIETWNPPMSDLFGWSAAEAIGHALVTLVIPPDLREAHIVGLARWEATEITVVACKHLRTEGLHKDGSLVGVFVDVQIVRDDAGVRFLGWVARDEGDDGSGTDCCGPG